MIDGQILAVISGALGQADGYLFISHRVWRVAAARLGIVMPTGIGRDELEELTGQQAQLVEILPASDYD